MNKKCRLQRYLEAKRQWLDHPSFHSIRHRLHAETLWQLNRRSVAGGVAAGLFAAFLPFPMQMLIAAGLAILWKSNMPIALISTWISNPITYAPIFYSNYTIGLFIVQLFHPVQPHEILEKQSLLNHIQAIGAPFILGSICAASIAASMGYTITRTVWRFITIRKYCLRRQRHKRRKTKRRFKS